MAAPDASPNRLDWLKAPPPDFRAQCESVHRIEGDRSDALRRLASFALSESQLLSIDRHLRRSTGKTPSLATFKLGFLSNATTDFILPAVRGTGVRHGFAIEVTAPPFGVTLQTS